MSGDPGCERSWTCATLAASIASFLATETNDDEAGAAIAASLRARSGPQPPSSAFSGSVCFSPLSPSLTSFSSRISTVRPCHAREKKGSA